MESCPLPPCQTMLPNAGGQLRNLRHYLELAKGFEPLTL